MTDQPQTRPTQVPAFREISSDTNPTFKDLKKAKDNEHQDLCIASGLRFFDMIPPTSLQVIAVKKSWLDAQSPNSKARKILQTYFDQPVQRLVLSDPLFDSINPSNVPDCVFALRKPLSTRIALNELFQWKGSTLLLTGRNPLNLGAQIRTAAAFGLDRVVRLSGSVDPFHSLVIRSSAGASLRYSPYHTDGISALGEFANTLSAAESKRLILFDLEGQPLPNFRFPKNPIFLFGEEGQGLADFAQSHRCSQVNIPMSKSVESLNLGASTAIALYAWHTRQ